MILDDIAKINHEIFNLCVNQAKGEFSKGCIDSGLNWCGLKAWWHRILAFLEN